MLARLMTKDYGYVCYWREHRLEPQPRVPAAVEEAGSLCFLVASLADHVTL